MVMFIALHPMESISLNSFDLLEHLAILLTSTLTINCSGIQFNLLLSPYPCFISLLNLDLYVLGDDALIS